MKRIIQFIIKNLIGGVVFGIGVVLTGIIVVYAATTINSLGGNSIESGDKMGSGWFQEVDSKLSEVINWVDNEGKNKADKNEVVNLTDDQIIGGKKEFSGNSVFQGKIGVGMTSPNERFDIEGNIDLNDNNIKKRGNYWWGRIGVDVSGVVWTTKGGNSGSFSFPEGGSTNCSSNDEACVYNDGNGNYMGQFEIPNKYTLNWGGGDPAAGIGGMCWIATSGDNEMRNSEIGDGATEISSDYNGHCLGNIDDCAGFVSHDSGSSDTYGVVCWLPNGG